VLQDDAIWHAPPETERLLSLMAPTHAAKVADARRRSQAERRPIVGCGYRRMRGMEGRRAQRFEVRFDEMAGALRTDKGGSSRQFVVAVDPDGRVRSRRMTPREYARLMGLPDSYRLPGNEADAIDLVGDGDCVSVVRRLAERVFEPVLGRPTVTAAERGSERHKERSTPAGEVLVGGGGY
jgi:DNA (cytosine-5)-methyltransferase 1